MVYIYFITKYIYINAVLHLQPTPVNIQQCKNLTIINNNCAIIAHIYFIIFVKKIYEDKI